MNPQVRERLNRRIGGDVLARLESETFPLNAPSGFGLAVELTKRAAARLGLEVGRNFVPVRIVDAEFYLSQTRLGQLVVELELPAALQSAGFAIELLHNLAHGQPSGTKWARLCRLSSHGAVLTGSNGKLAAGSFSLHELAVSLACPEGDGTCMIDAPRAFTYVLASCGGERIDAEERRELTARFARRLNADYSPGSALEGAKFAAPFETVTTACTCEGGATLVSGTGDVEFLENFVKDSGHRVYLRLALLAHKEMHDLVSLSQGTAITIEHSESDDEQALRRKLAQIRQMQERALNYRLAHRFTLAGYNTNHNLVHAAWRDAIQTDRLLQDLAGDVDEAGKYLVEANKRLRSAREAETQAALMRKASWLQAGLAFLASLEGMKALVDLLKEMRGVANWLVGTMSMFASAFGYRLDASRAHEALSSVVEAAPFCIAALAATLVLYFSRKGLETGNS